MSPERVSITEKGEDHSMQMDRNRKGAGTNSGESGAMNLEADYTECVYTKTLLTISHKAN